MTRLRGRPGSDASGRHWGFILSDRAPLEGLIRKWLGPICILYASRQLPGEWLAGRGSAVPHSEEAGDWGPEPCEPRG